MTDKLTDAQIALLRSGCQRADQCIVAPAGKGARAGKSAAKMIDAGWLKEIKTRAGAPVWRTDEATGATYSFKLTVAGLKIVAAHDLQGSGTDAAPTVPGGADVHDHKDPPALIAENRKEGIARPNFREGSKLAEVMKLLRQDGGVTVDELSAVMNWLPHSTRAVLTGLRKRGVLVARRKTPDQRASAYIVETNSASANGQG